jgi:hypothetical protein
VLIENPDRAELWAHEEILRGAGYEVAACTGPSAASAGGAGFQHRSFILEGMEPAKTERTLCPLVAGQRCPLVDGADVVISSTSLVDGREILAAHDAEGRARLVVEGARQTLERDRDVMGGDATVIVEPVTEERLLAAVRQALEPRSEEE